MYKTTPLFIYLSLFIILFSSCSITSKPEGTTEVWKNIDPIADEPLSVINKDSYSQPEVKVDKIKEQMNDMTLDEKIGQMVIAGFDGYTLNDESRNLINSLHVGGIILFSRNADNTVQLLELINSLKEANFINKTPLFISVDEEGGQVSRMPSEFYSIPSNGVIGKINNTEFSFKIGSVIAAEIASLGFNMDFAPVLDINSNPNNPVIRDRSFSSDPEVVSNLGVQTMKGIQSGNIIPVVKHFPGHGDTSTDSHVSLPTVDNDLKRLNNLELIPFAKAIENGADMVMAAHILLPKIDPDYPASLSKIIITDILRKDLNFDGVVITDDMTMGAIVENYNIGEASVKSILAGSDIILICHDYNNVTLVIDTIEKAVKSGVIPESRIDESVYRVLKLKDKYKLSDKKIDSVDVNKINDKISSLLNIYTN